MKKVSTFLAFILGSVVGAVVALLYAPRSGEETRQIIMENSQKVKQSVSESLDDFKGIIDEEIAELRERVDLYSRETEDYINRLKEAQTVKQKQPEGDGGKGS